LLLTSFFIIPNQSANSFNKITIPQGVASGDVTNSSAIVWSRSNTASIMNVQYNNNSNINNDFPSNNIVKTEVNSSTDFTGHVKLTNLNPNTTYYYKVWFNDINNSSIKSDNKTGKFKTSPNKNTPLKEISFIIGGDLGGSKLCRQIGLGYPIFSIMKSTNSDFFIFSGDQIYADSDCPSNPIGSNINKDYPYWHNMEGNFPSIAQKNKPHNYTIDWNNETTLHQIYLDHWLYNRDDPNQQNLLNSTSMYSQGDDHEVIDNYGKLWKSYSITDDKNLTDKTGYPNLVKTGMDLFFKFSPIERNQTEHDKIYRMFNWGKDIDLFLLDDHSYRSLNNLPDLPQNNKTLYGKEQLNWLKSHLLTSNATWKVISNPVPITLPDCFGPNQTRNNWATNSTTNNLTFTTERNSFLKFLDDNNIKNIGFITTDVHFAGTVKVVQDFNGDGDLFTFYEMADGPLSTYTRNSTNAVDLTLNGKYLYNESGIFNFGKIKINQEKDGKSTLEYKVIDSNGRVRPNSFKINVRVI